MKQQLKNSSDTQKKFWDQFSTGWKKWELKFYEHMQPAADGIINKLNPTGSQLILDIAAGTGEPGLSIAKMLTSGKVIITDLSDEMLNIARENAIKKGITNVEFKAFDVSELSFPDETFDAASCRMGFMFFPDMLLAAKEIMRVLKPGGKLAITVWGSARKEFLGNCDWQFYK